MKIKKYAVFVMALCCILAGCSGMGRHEDDKTTVITWIFPSSKQEDVDSVLEEVNKIIEPELGVTLDLQFVHSTSYENTMKNYMASGKEFDICFTGYCNDYQQAAQNGVLMPLNELIDKEAPEIRDLIPEYVLESAEVNGEIYGIPNLQVMSNPDCVVIFKDLAEKYNYDYSSFKELKDLEPYLKSVKENEPDMYPYRGTLGTRAIWYTKYEMVLDYTEIVIRKDGSSYELLKLQETPEYLESIDLMRDWYKKGYIRPDIVSMGNDNTLLNEGKYAAFLDSWKPGNEVSLAKKYNRECVSLLLHEPYMQRTAALLSLNSIGINSKNPEKAIKLLKMVNENKELYNLLCFGIEGKHYNLTDDNKVQYIGNSGYFPNCDWAFGNQFNAYLIEGMEDDVYEQTERMNKEATKSPLLGFVPDTSAIANEMIRVTDVIDEFGVVLTGAVDKEAYWEEYNKKLKEAGQEKILEELQRQVDEFVKEKNALQEE